MYVTVDEIKQKEIKSLENLSDNKLECYIELMSGEVDEYCNTKFKLTKDIYTLDYKRKFFTRKQPLISVNNIELEEYPLFENEDFFVYTEKSRIELAEFKVERVKKAIKIEYLYGYKEVPATVKQVIIDLIKLQEESKNAILNGIQSENFDGEYSYSLHSSKDFTPSELRKAILERLDIFKVKPYIETNNNRIVKAMLL